MKEILEALQKHPAFISYAMQVIATVAAEATVYR